MSWKSIIEDLQTILNRQDVCTLDALPEENAQTISALQEHKDNLSQVSINIQSIQEQLNLILQNIPPVGKQYWCSTFNPIIDINIGDQVAFKPSASTTISDTVTNNFAQWNTKSVTSIPSDALDEVEWFQCIVMSISEDGLQFQVQDPEPDEMGNVGKIYNCSWKDIIPLPMAQVRKNNLVTTTNSSNNNGNTSINKIKLRDLKQYPIGTKVLAQYPETTTFYPAIVSKYDKRGKELVYLRFDGEEEVDKQTVVVRSLVLPYPTVSAMPINEAKRH